MTNNEKQLLLQDLCARLPYGVKIHGPKENDDILWELDYNMDIKKIVDDGWLPYLRPMSSMTEEEKDELYTFIDWVASFDDDGNLIIDEYVSGINLSTINKYVDWLNAHHFDYRGLIEKGLALEAPEEMYKLN